MFYTCVRAIVGFAIRLFYRVKIGALPPQLGGPVMFVCNHPNSIVDPALLFAVLPRQITFLAREPLFRAPVFGWILRGLGALPVFRKQDHPGQTEKNQGTFDSASRALLAQGAITLFPEGKSHSEPRLAEIKTGAARIALQALAQGAAVRIVPVGLTYQQKHRFRSEVLVEASDPIEVANFAEGQPEAERVRELTEAVEAGLSRVTLNLEQWEDLPLIQTGDELYSLKIGERSKDPARLRRFARGVELFRKEQPEKFEHLRDEVMTYRRRLELVSARTRDLALTYNRALVWKFALRNLAALILGFPLFGMGMLLFAVPFYIPRYLVKVLHQSLDRQGTVKFVTALVLTPISLGGMIAVAWVFGGNTGAAVVFLSALPLALFTRYFFERRRIALRDMKVFFTLGSRVKLRAMLLAEGDRLAAEIEATALEYKPRVMEPVPRTKASG
ncbi:MAG: 1-acyl-sn-glycerol-3-phosphate acyltransferase [Myxococcota bacterium]|nr:1-acyl-sn-glycerol-3-phosphate acyltransferase [Myxococcota bacterium]